jgi:nucleotide-binding universal stress UspA family protein
MYETVLWATNASSLADGALAEALTLLQPGGHLVAFYCDERCAAGRANGVTLLADTCERQEKIRQQVDDLQADGIDVTLVVDATERHVVGEIAKAAEEHDADVIVCGTRGFGIVAGAVAGSVAMRLPHVATCPVVVVSERAAQRAASRKAVTA